MKEYINQEWQTFSSSGEKTVRQILKERNKLNREICLQGGDKIILQENGALALHKVVALYDKYADLMLKKSILKKVLNGVDLQDECIVECPNLSLIIDNYYFLQFVMEGKNISQAKTCRYERYCRVLELNNPLLILNYLSGLSSVFIQEGYTSGMEKIRPYVEQFMPEGNLKTELMQLYKKYAHLREGMEAPQVKLVDMYGKTYSFADFRGKILVVDVWAIWCKACIAYLPRFLDIRKEYMDCKDVMFVTVCINNITSFYNWKYLLPHLNLMGVVNLLALGEKDFKDQYNIIGIPRYFLIDKKGKIVTVWAPKPGKELKELIDNLLNDKK